MTKKVLMNLQEDTITMADEAVEIAKPLYSSRTQLIEMAIREKAQAIKEKYENDRSGEIGVEEN